MDFEWMAWTPVTAGFFIFIGVVLTIMAVWEVVSPSVPRRGLLPLTTTRGDRLFMGLLGGAYTLLAWVGLTHLSLWYGLALALAFLCAMLRWG